MSNKTKIYKHFCIQDYKNNFSKKYLKEYFLALDGFLQMGGKLMANFDYNQYFTKPVDEEITFDELFETFSKWAVNDQEVLNYEDFAAAENKKGAGHANAAVQDFKKMTDRVV